MSLASDFSVGTIFKPEDKIFIPGCSAEPRSLVQAISEQSVDLPKLEITNTFIPGVNSVSLAAENNRLNEVVFFPRRGHALETDRIDFNRKSWLEVYQILAHREFDWVVVHVSPTDEAGDCSLGTSIEFLPLVLNRAKRVLAVINKQMPNLPNAPKINVSRFDATVEVDEPLVNYAPAPADDVSVAIAKHLGTLIDDHAELQVGLGNVPEQLVKSLQGRKNLRFHSGMLSDGFYDLFEDGALDPDFEHICTLTMGSKDFYKNLPAIPNLHLVPANVSHATNASGGVFTAINSALQIDLRGRANLEFVGNNRVSSIGGALDFARRANMSKHSKNIIALPATAKQGQISRIVNKLESSEHDSLAQHSPDFVVTEFGIADLRGLSGNKKANRLIDIAAPQFRAALSYLA